MAEKFQNKYRIASARLQNWDYGSNAAYFVTICTKHRECFFGDVVDGALDDGADDGVETQNIASLSKPPKPSNTSTPRQKIMELSPIGQIAERCWLDIPKHFPFVKLDAHIIMPNHVHGIIMIDKPNPNSTDHPMWQKNRFGSQSQNLPSIVRGFKIGVTKNARMINPNFSWQPRYHDHIIKSNHSFQRIAAYILNNPSKWSDDKFHIKESS